MNPPDASFEEFSRQRLRCSLAKRSGLGFFSVNVVATLSISLLLCTAAFAQAPPAQSEQQNLRRLPSGRPTLQDAIDVRLIRLDAVVSDRSGTPVPDLGPKDFDLRVDGKKVKVSSVSTATDLVDSIGGRLTLVLILDESHLSPLHRNHVLDAIEPSLLAALDAGPTWVAVVALPSQSERSVESVESVEPLLAPTRDSSALRQALEAAKDRTTTASELLSVQRSISTEARDILDQMARGGSSYRYGQAALRSLVLRARSYGQLLVQDTNRTLEALEELVDALSFLPGRKALLFATDGLPREPLDSLASTMNDRLAAGSSTLEGRDTIDNPNVTSINTTNARSTGTDLGDGQGETVVQLDDGGASQFQRLVSDLAEQERFERLSALANAHRVTFYPIKAPLVDPALSGLGGSSTERGSVSQISDMASGLEALAYATGGLPFLSEGSLEEFVTRTKEDVSSYYALSFTPPDGLEDSAIRTVELKVRRKRTKVRHRASYVPLTMEESLASRAWGTLLFNWQENPHALEVETSQKESPEAPSRDEPRSNGKHEVEVLVSLPIDELELIDNGEVVAGNFRSVVQLRSKNGARFDPRNIGFVVAIPRVNATAAAGQYFALRAAFELADGDYEMAVGLWEENTGKTSFVVHDFEVGQSSSTVALLPTAPQMKRPMPRNTAASP